MNPVSFSMVLKDDLAAGRWLEDVRAAGFCGLEPTFGLEGTLPTAADPRKSAERLRGMADQVGLKVPSLRGGPGFWGMFGAADEGKRKGAAELAAKAMEAVRIMGGDTLLVVPGQWEAGRTYAQVWRAAVETAKWIGDAAERTGIKVGLENVENRFLISPRDWVAFLDEVNHPLVRMYFDVGNVVYVGAGWPEEWIRELGRKYITRIHFKDADQRGALRYMLEGQVNWPAVSAAMREMEYRDWVGVELVLPGHHPGAMLAGAYRAAEAILKGGAA